MKNNKKIGGIFLSVCFYVLALTVKAENGVQEKKLTDNLEKFVTSSRRSNGDYSTISLRSWRNELGMPPLSTEDMIRRVLHTFELQYKNLKVLDYLIIYDSKPSGAMMLDFLIIHHETEKPRVARFETK